MSIYRPQVLNLNLPTQLSSVVGRLGEEHIGNPVLESTCNINDKDCELSDLVAALDQQQDTYVDRPLQADDEDYQRVDVKSSKVWLQSSFNCDHKEHAHVSSGSYVKLLGTTVASCSIRVWLKRYAQRLCLSLNAGSMASHAATRTDRGILGKRFSSSVLLLSPKSSVTSRKRHSRGFSGYQRQSRDGPVEITHRIRRKYVDRHSGHLPRG